jgi:hypothetical protein
MEVKLDKHTLPADGEKVRFKLYKDVWKEGIYMADENLFFISEEEFYDAWIVFEWEIIN